MKQSHTFKLAFFFSVALSTLLFSAESQAVDADSAKALAKQNSCFSCHGLDKDKDGPAFNKIAAKFKADPKAKENLLHILTSAQTVKFPDGHEEPHMVLQSGDPNQISNLIDWILSF